MPLGLALDDHLTLWIPFFSEHLYVKALPASELKASISPESEGPPASLIALAEAAVVAAALAGVVAPEAPKSGGVNPGPPAWDRAESISSSSKNRRIIF